VKDSILDAAEARARRAGYNGFSFREIADDVGIKSASVHYHFPTKEDLAAALAQRYVERILAQLGDPIGRAPRAAIRHLADVFIAANETDNQMCLCGVFAAESGGLPPQVLPKVASFFELTTKWLDTALKPASNAPKAIEIIAALEGGLLISRVRHDPAILRAVVASILRRIPA
jgi:TetR/AcrR family transcriptional repressor of nem operon